MARKIAEALRVTLSPEELEALAIKPTENLQAYDLYLRGKRYARRQTRQDLEFALQMFENAVAIDPSFALAYAACANACAMFYCNYSRDQVWVERARESSGKAVALRWDLPEVQVSQAWVLYAAELHDEAVRMVKKAIERKRDCEGAYYLLCRALFAAGRYQEIVDVADTAIEASGEDYNVYVPIVNAFGAMGKEEAKGHMTQRRMAAFENHLKQVPEDARARVLLGGDYAKLGRPDDALRELNLAVTLRANEASILYNAACLYCKLTESRMPWIPWVKPGKLGTGIPRGLAVIRTSSFFMTTRSLTACTRRSLRHSPPPVPTNSASCEIQTQILAKHI
jgi:tetratricopeptide (TPR) repeat protein